MIIHTCQQRSEEWQRLRLGIPTASCFSKIITPKTMKLSSSADGYMLQLLAEWMYGAPLDDARSTYQSQAMQFGQDAEPAARAEYELLTGSTVDTVGFVTDNAGLVGCSPDGLITINSGIAVSGGLELKGHASLPEHVRQMLHRSIADDHKPQVQGCLWLCERDWWDVMSYFPQMPSVIVRAHRDEQYIAALKLALEAFTETLAKARERIVQLYGQFPRPVELQARELSEFDITEEDVAAILKNRI